MLAASAVIGAMSHGHLYRRNTRLVSGTLGTRGVDENEITLLTLLQET